MKDTPKTILSQVESEHDLTLRDVMRLFGRSRDWVEDHAEEFGLYWVQGARLAPVPMFRATQIRAWRDKQRYEGTALAEVKSERVRDFALQADLAIPELAVLLGRSPAWASKNRNLFKWYYVPGRGRTGREVRFERTSVLEYLERLRSQSNGNGVEEHETVEQIINRVKAKRAAAGQSL